MLARIVARASSRLSLITIDNEIPSGTLDKTTFTLDKAPRSVVEAVINQVLPNLPPEDQHRLVRFSEGFPAIANRIGRTWADSMPVAHAAEEHFVEAFVLGYAQDQRETAQVGEAAGYVRSGRTIE